ncbi:MAG: hypothetical protein ABFR32_05575 [Bacteroidota bacterium]
MKNIYLILFLIFFTSNIFGQEKNRKIEQVGDLFEVTIYYDNGQIMQHGFLSKNKKLHASWESYYEDGSRKCVAIYDNGVKVGTWFYYDIDKKKTKVIYDNNKIISAEKVDSIHN